MKNIHLMLSEGAADALTTNDTNSSLRQWLTDAYHNAQPAADQATLFGRDVPVADDIPLLLAAASQATGSRVEELIERWAQNYAQHPAPAVGTDATVDEVLDLLETLFEEVIEDAQRRCGVYPEGEQLMHSAERLFETLRQLIASRTAA